MGLVLARDVNLFLRCQAQAAAPAVCLYLLLQKQGESAMYAVQVKKVGYPFERYSSPSGWAMLSAIFLAGMVSPATAEEATQQHPDVVVSASRVPLPAKEIGSAVTVITEEELKQRQVRIVSDVLRDVPGVSVNRTGPVGSLTQIRIRGAEGNQTKVLIDGIEVNNPASGSEFNFANLLNAEIERIEVLRGPQSALYGSDAIGGVVNIITKDPDPGFTLNTRAEAGSFRTADGLASLGYGSEKFSLTGTVQRFTTDGISIADEKNGNSERDGYDNTTGRIKIGVKPVENLELRAVGMIVDSKRDGDASAAVVGAVDSDDTSKSLQRYGLASAKYTIADGAWEHLLKATYLDDDTDYFDGSGTQTFTSNGKQYSYSYQTNYNFTTGKPANADHVISFAAERDEEEQYTNSSFSGPNSVSIVNHGYASEYRIGLWDQLFLSGAVRFDDNDDLFKNQTTYRGTAAYLFEESATRLHASFGRAVKNPTLFELFGSTPTFTGNPNLKPEEGIGWDAGIEQSFFDDRLILDVTYFNNRIKDLIQGSGNTATNVAGTSRIQGIEVTASTEPFENFNLDAAYTYTNGKDAQGTRLIRRPMHVASLVGNYRFDVRQRPANINLSVQFNGKQDDIVFDNFFPVDTRTVSLKAYTLVNLAASYEIFDGASLFVRGENLLNQDYQEVFGYGTPGISFFAGFTLKFGPFANATD